MNVKELSMPQRNARSNIRNFLMVASLAELEREIETTRKMVNNERPDCRIDERTAAFRIACINELIDESKREMNRR